jgi:hypothetical protein
MRILITVFALLVLVTGMASAAIDGKWVAERKMERDGRSFTIIQTFDFRSEGNQLTGKMTMQFGEMEPRTIEIKDGKIDGGKFSFTTVFSTPNGDFKTNYEGTVEGATLKGVAETEGRGEPRPFEARRK